MKTPSVNRMLLIALWAFAQCLASQVSAEVSAYPSDPYSSPQLEVRKNLDHLYGVQIVSGVEARAEGFHFNEIETVPVAEGGYATRWRFNRKPGSTAPTALAVGETIPREPISVTVHFKNLSKSGFLVSLLVDEKNWHPGKENKAITWIIGEGRDIQPGHDGDVAFNWSEAVPSKADIGRGISYPLGNMTFVLQPIHDNEDYELILDNLRIACRAAEGPSIKCQLPQDMKAGGPFEAVISAEASAGSSEKPLLGKSAGEALLDMEFIKGGSVCWRLRLDKAEKDALESSRTVRIKRTVPWFLPTGEYEAVLALDGYRIDGAKAALQVQNGIKPGLPTVERRLSGGRPSLFVNGKPFCWSGYASYDFSPGNVNDFGQAGATVFCVPANAGRHVHPGISAPIRMPDGTYDFTELDELVCQSLTANPEAYILPRVSFSLLDKEIQELKAAAVIRTSKGDLTWEETGMKQVSVGSEKWKEHQREGLIQFIRHCESQPWAERVLGILLSGMLTEEWFAWASNDGKYSDYSQCNEEAFTGWLAAQGRPSMPIPSPADRQRPGYDLYPCDSSGKASAAYAQYCSDKASEAISYFARAVKEETQGKSLAGCFYGYVVQLAGEPRQHLGGNFDLRPVLDDPNIDFLSGIPLHNFRDLTNGYNPYASATESILAAGKLYLNENDLFSHLHNLIWHREYDPKDPAWGTLQMHRRELAADMIHGTQRQWFSLMATWHHDADLLKEFASQIEFRNSLPKYNIAGTEEIALVIDDRSFAWLPPETKMPAGWIPYQLYHLGRTGAPAGVWLLSDIDKLPERIKFVVVSGCHAPQSKDLEKLKGAIAEGKRSFLLVGPVGLIDPEKEGWRDSFIEQAAEVTDASGPTRMLLPDGAALGDSGMARPTVKIRLEPLARYADGSIAAGEKPLQGGGRLIVSGAPVSNVSWLREQARRAGVHLYAPENFFVHASHDLVSITSPFDGTYDLNWPQEIQATDLYSGWDSKGKTMPCPFKAGETRLFYIR